MHSIAEDGEAGSHGGEKALVFILLRATHLVWKPNLKYQKEGKEIHDGYSNCQILLFEMKTEENKNSLNQETKWEEERENGRVIWGINWNIEKGTGKFAFDCVGDGCIWCLGLCVFFWSLETPKKLWINKWT